MNATILGLSVALVIALAAAIAVPIVAGGHSRVPTRSSHRTQLWTGSLGADSVWNPAEGTYIVSHLVVPAGKVLTVEPGTHIGVAPNQMGIVVQGTLHLSGAFITSTRDPAGGAHRGSVAETGDYFAAIQVLNGALVTIDRSVIKYGVFSIYGHGNCSGARPSTITVNQSVLGYDSEGVVHLKNVLCGGALTVTQANLGRGDGPPGILSETGTATAQHQAIILTGRQFTDPAPDVAGQVSDASGRHFAVFQVALTNDGDAPLYMTGNTGSFKAVAYGWDGAAYEQSNNTPGGVPICPLAGSNSADTITQQETVGLCFGFALPKFETIRRITVSPQPGQGSGTITWHIADRFSDFG